MKFTGTQRAGESGFEKEQGMTSELPTRNVVNPAAQRPPQEQGLDVHKVLGGLWRRKKLVAAVALVVGAVGAAVVASTPSVYRADVTVRVEPSRLSPELVNPTVTQQIEDRLKTIQSELFARPLLERVVQEQNLYPGTVKKQGLEAAAAELRHHMDVKVEGEDAFDLTFEDSDPKVAAAVANRLPELFAQETLKVRADQAEAAQQLFSDELNTLTRQVADQETKLSQFKLAHMGELPEQLESNMRQLERLTMLLGQRGDALRDAQHRLNEASRGRIDADGDAGRLARHESDLQLQLDNAKSTYTADHPDVVRMQRELAAVHSQRTGAESAERNADSSRRLAAAEVSSISRELETLQTQVDLYRRRLDATPKWSVPLAALDQQYDVLKQKYQQMVSRKVEADLAHDAELRARATMFHVLAAGEVPASPARPDRAAGYLLVALAAIALGLLSGVVLELNDDSLRDVGDTHHTLRLPVLATVPNLGRGTLIGSGKSLRPAVNRQTLDA